MILFPTKPDSPEANSPSFNILGDSSADRHTACRPKPRQEFERTQSLGLGLLEIVLPTPNLTSQRNCATEVVCTINRVHPLLVGCELSIVELAFVQKQLCGGVVN
jgi:hypothetical protein